MINLNLYITYKHKHIPTYIFNNLLKYNPEYNIHLYDDNDIIKFLTDYFDTNIVECFKFIPNGAIKADLFRVCVLYIYGGIYCDIDIVPQISFNKIIENNTIFLTSTSRIPGLMNPIILMSYPNNLILKYCINYYKYMFENQYPFDFWSWSICSIMHKAIRHTLDIDIVNNMHHDLIIENMHYRFLTEVDGHDRSQLKTIYKDKIVCYNHYNTYSSRGFGGGENNGF